MKAALHVLVWLLICLTSPPAFALYRCPPSLNGTTTIGTLQTGLTVKLTLAITCLRNSSENAHPSPNRNRPTMQVDLSPTTTPPSTATLTNGANTLPYVVTFGALGTSPATAPEPTCANTGAPTNIGLGPVVYSQSSSATSTPALTFSSNTATSSNTGYVKVCLVVPAAPGAAVGTYSQSLTFRGLVLNINNNQILSFNYVFSSTVTGTCSVVASDLSIPYTSFGPTATAYSTVTANCSTGLNWSVALDAPTSGTNRGIAYELGLDLTSTVPSSGPLATFLTGQSGTKTIYLHGRALAGLAGSAAACAAPCSNGHSLTVSY